MLVGALGAVGASPGCVAAVLGGDRRRRRARRRRQPRRRRSAGSASRASSSATPRRPTGAGRSPGSRPGSSSRWAIAGADPRGDRHPRTLGFLIVGWSRGRLPSTTSALALVAGCVGPDRRHRDRRRRRVATVEARRRRRRSADSRRSMRASQRPGASTSFGVGIGVGPRRAAARRPCSPARSTTPCTKRLAAGDLVVAEADAEQLLDERCRRRSSRRAGGAPPRRSAGRCRRRPARRRRRRPSRCSRRRRRRAASRRGRSACCSGDVTAPSSTSGSPSACCSAAIGSARVGVERAELVGDAVGSGRKPPTCWRTRSASASREVGGREQREPGELVGEHPQPHLVERDLPVGGERVDVRRDERDGRRLARGSAGRGCRTPAWRGGRPSSRPPCRASPAPSSCDSPAIIAIIGSAGRVVVGSSSPVRRATVASSVNRWR